MRSSDFYKRLVRLEDWLTPSCRVCYGAGSIIVMVPQGADEMDPQWSPSHCRGCGAPLRFVQQIIGISEEEMETGIALPAEDAG